MQLCMKVEPITPSIFLVQLCCISWNTHVKYANNNPIFFHKKIALIIFGTSPYITRIKMLQRKQRKHLVKKWHSVQNNLSLPRSLIMFYCKMPVQVPKIYTHVFYEKYVIS